MIRFDISVKTCLLAGTATLFAGSAYAQQTEPAVPTTPESAPAATAPVAAAPGDSSLNEIVVTGSTSGRRTLLTSSSDVTLATAADIARKAPRATADLLELVPGMYVEGTAGPASNNYSVRGLRGGAQTFVTLEEDGMPILYAGGGADFYFQPDITIDRVEAVEGGTSGILSVNGAAATVNFISQKPNFDKYTGMVRVTGSSYGEMRGDAYVTGPIGDGIAFNLGGYFDSTPGVRKSPFIYNTYRLKGMLEKRFDDGGFIRFTLKRSDSHDPYYADQPYHVEANGDITGVPGLGTQRGNILGRGFQNIAVPDSCATGTCLRTFNGQDGIHTTAWQYRLDIEKPVTEALRLFARTRYLDGKYDFNGIFPGSTGISSLSTASAYLDPALSPVGALLTSGLAAFPGTTQFGLRNTVTGQIIPASDTATLNALNGNGLLQQTVLNHQTLATKDLGSNFGGTWDYDTGIFENSLTLGGMYYWVRRYNDQSAVAYAINDVRNNSNLYDIVGLNAAGGVTGSLTNNGMTSYGDWGQGIFRDETHSISGYFNDELKIGSNLHIDFGARYERQHDVVDIGNTAEVNQPVPAGTPGLAQTVGSTFDGTYTRQSATYDHWATTVGVNYTITRNLAVYGRFATGFQTNGGDTGGVHKPTSLKLYEGGVRYQNRWAAASVTVFRTEFNNQTYTFPDPANQANTVNFVGDMATTGVQYQVNVRPFRFFSVDAQGVYQRPKLSNVSFNGVGQDFYNGKVPERTPKWLATITPAIDLPHGLGQIYMRWKYVGKVFADSGNGLALPSYSVISFGGNVNLTDRLNLNISVDNVTNELGLTEGNPRQGQTQSIVNGYFYGRGIVGTNALGSLTFKF